MNDGESRQQLTQPTDDALQHIQQCTTSEQSGLVDVNFGTSTGDNRRGYPSMASIAEKHPKIFETLAEELEEMGNHFFRYVNGKTIKATSRYLSDVILVGSNRERDLCLGLLREYGKRRRNGLFGFSAEGDHIHVIHDCTYSGGYCRDVWRDQVKSYGHIKSVRKYNKRIWDFKRTDWYDVFIYFFVEKRGEREIWIGGESGQIPSDSELVRWQGKREAARQMVRSDDCSSDSECERQTVNRHDRKRHISPSKEIYAKKTYSSGKFAYIKSQTKTLLKKYYCSPVSAIRDISEFRNDNLLSDPKNKEYILTAFDDFGKDLNSYTLRELYNMLESTNPLFFTSFNYDNRENSIKVVEELVKYQCNDDHDEICQFLSYVVAIMDRTLPKTNAICIISPPSGGKNFFFDMILAICLNYGQLGQANKHNVFAFQEAPNKRVLLWNEPNYESCLTDTIKMMMAGDPYTVRVKHSMDTHVARTPVIILTNKHVPFMTDLAFADRIVQFTWKAAPFLKDYEMKPYPMCFFDLLIKYNIAF